MLTSRRTLSGVLAGFLTILGLANLCRADGFIVIDNPPVIVERHFSFAPLQVSYHHVSVEIDDQVAVTKVDEEFYNPNGGAALEGNYIFPLPEGAHIDKFSMDINGKQMEAELLSADKARALYEQIVRKAKDPALLEYAGRDAFKVHIFPIEPNSRKRIELQYTQVLNSDTGLVQYVYPMNTEKFSSALLGDVSVDVKLHSKSALKSVYSPSHNVKIDRPDDTDATIHYGEQNVRPDIDFKLIYSRSEKDLGIDLLSYRAGSGDGYFLLMASPGMQIPKVQQAHKDVCFVLDTSGSMAGPKMEQAKKALSFCLNNLTESDRFEVIRFSTESEPLFGELKTADKQNVQKALDFVSTMEASGGTAIDEALQKALALRKPTNQGGKETANPYLVVFLTDGMPTVGETDEDKVAANVKRESGDGLTRVFCFGLGNDVNTHLLDRIASNTRASSAYVLPQEDIEVKVSNFYAKIKEPMLTNLTLAFTGDNIHTSAVYPNAIPDLFKGDMLLAFGRYSGSGAAAVKITGTLNGETKEFVQDVNFTDKDTHNAFIPHLWATRRVGWLLDEIRMHGESAELKEEVIRLARDNGIVTPYTSFLILEDEKNRRVPLAMQTQREFDQDRGNADQARQAYLDVREEAAKDEKRTGGGAVENAQAVQALKEADNAQQADASGTMLRKAIPAAPDGQHLAQAGQSGGAWKYGQGMPAAAADSAASEAPLVAATQPVMGYRQAQNYAQQACMINGRAFYQNGTTWTDATAQGQQNLQEKKIAFNSDEYFDLLNRHPEAAGWLSLGNEIDVVLDDTLYRIR